MKRVLIFLSVLPFAKAKVHIVQSPLHLQMQVRSWIELKNRNLTRQHHDYSCGSASLSTILSYFYDTDTTESEILDAVLKMKGLTNQSTLEEYKKANGLSFLDLRRFASAKGFRAIGVALDLEALRKLKIPAILYVKVRENEHFTVLKTIDDNYAYLADPSFGNTKVKLSKFKEMFYQRDDLKYPGKALLVLPVDRTTKQNKSFMKVPQRSLLIEETIRSRVLSR